MSAHAARCCGVKNIPCILVALMAMKLPGGGGIEGTIGANG